MIHLNLIFTSLEGLTFILLGSSYNIPVRHMVQINCPSNLKEQERVGLCWRIAFVLWELFPSCSQKGGMQKAVLMASFLHVCLGWEGSVLAISCSRCLALGCCPSAFCGYMLFFFPKLFLCRPLHHLKLFSNTNVAARLFYHSLNCSCSSLPLSLVGMCWHRTALFSSPQRWLCFGGGCFFSSVFSLDCFVLVNKWLSSSLSTS